MDTKASFVAGNGNVLDSLIIYTIHDGWHYCQVSVVQELDGFSLGEPLRLKQPLSVDYRVKLRLGAPSSKNCELFSYVTPMGVWDDRYIDGVRDEDFPPLELLDEELDDSAESAEVVSEVDKEIFDALDGVLGERFTWPSSLCMFCLKDTDQAKLKTLANGLLGHSDKGFEACLWKWCLIPTWARTSLFEENYSKAAE